MNEKRRNNANYYRHKYYKVHPTMAQVDMVVQYMKLFGSITQGEAYLGFDCMRLGARIADLRAIGYAIRTDRAKGKTPYGIYSFADTNKETE